MPGLCKPRTPQPFAPCLLGIESSRVGQQKAGSEAVGIRIGRSRSFVDIWLTLSPMNMVPDRVEVSFPLTPVRFHVSWWKGKGFKRI